mgnify:CR=1 FL=1
MALVLALFIRTFIVQAFKIPSGSMIPSFVEIGDHILVTSCPTVCACRFWNATYSNIRRRAGATWWYSSTRRIVPGRFYQARNPASLAIRWSVRAKRFLSTAGGRRSARSLCRLRSPGGRGRSGDDYGPKVVPSNHIFVMRRQSRPQLRQPFLGLCQSLKRCAAKPS